MDLSGKIKGHLGGANSGVKSACRGRNPCRGSKPYKGCKHCKREARAVVANLAKAEARAGVANLTRLQTLHKGKLGQWLQTL